MIYSLKDKTPKIGGNNYIAPNATLIGDIELGEDVSIWFGAVLRGDMSKITIGNASNIQDNCTVHGDTPYPVILGEWVTVGHNALIHGCTIGDIVVFRFVVQGHIHSEYNFQIWGFWVVSNECVIEIDGM